MSIQDFDTNKILMVILGSLVAYVFYGFIDLSAKVDTIETKQNQVLGEQRDLWNKYNDDQNKKFDFAVKFYEYKLEQEKTWKEFYKNGVVN